MIEDLKLGSMLEDLEIPVKRGNCRVRIVMESLSEQDAAILEQAVNNENWQLTVLSRELRKRDVIVSDNSLRRHRLKVCPCWRT